jgi:hypothetical protein
MMQANDAGKFEFSIKIGNDDDDDDDDDDDNDDDDDDDNDDGLGVVFKCPLCDALTGKRGLHQRAV